MAEWKLFDGDEAYVSTAEFHEHRERAPHLEQESHKERLLTAYRFVSSAAESAGGDLTVSDLGCGDGGLLSLVRNIPGVVRSWGYDFAPANRAGWQDRQVDGRLADVFGVNRDDIEFGQLTIVTEVLEHLTNPHGEVAWISEHSKYLVASSPFDEHGESHDACHAWAWDVEGYRNLIQNNGFRIVAHQPLNWKFQIVLAVSDNYEA
jgi:hypothetical protein